MNSKGNFGRILDIDLTHRRIDTREFTEAMALESLGGFGYNVLFLYQNLKEGCDPLGPENIMILSLGLLTGTAAPSSSRVHINALSPLSGLVGSSSVGGFLGSKLRSLGIAVLIIRGASETPVYLALDAWGVRFEDAGELWGRDTRQTDAALKTLVGDDRAEVLTIGTAGENRVRYACIMAGIDHAAGHTGMGAVMGSKRLKAISVSSAARAKKASPEAMPAVRAYLESIRNSVSRYRDYSQLGSSGDLLELNEMGLLGTRNYRSMQLEGAERIDGRNLKSYVVRTITCPRCIVHCKAEVELKEGRHRGFRGGRPEYETVIDLGALCGLTDPEALMYLSNRCNILGVDTISTGSVIAFAMDLYDRKILSRQQLDGIDLTWGNAEAMEQIMNRIAVREGIGDILAEGVFRAAERLGGGAEKYAYHVKGVELYGADPRGMMGTALSYAVSMRGGDFTSVYPVPEFRYTEERAEKEFGTRRAVDRLATGGKGALVRYCLIVSAIIDSLGICKVPALTIAGNYDLEKETRLVRALTSLDLTRERLLYIGERIVHMEKLFNLRFGATSELDTLPEKFLDEPIGEGPSTGAKVNLKPMVQDFYKRMGWDEQGVPRPQTLAAFNLP
ncbi:MAG: aldehyde ferredoxin oxidoreductase family protein [Spirochaetales bacterium]|nr:aldehyde ferredoxin oxidoreductase family protein [Spirochaetales bacterium]